MNAVYYQSPVGPPTLIEENGALTGCSLAAPRCPQAAAWPKPRCSAARAGSCGNISRASAPSSICPSPRPARPSAGRWGGHGPHPHGQTATYGQLAAAAGSPARPGPWAAPATLTPRHPFALPPGGWLHRVLTGFAGGLPVKEQLLALEAAHSVP